MTVILTVPRPAVTAAQACALSVGGALAGLAVGAACGSHWEAWLSWVETWHRAQLAKERLR